jgi:hypothetical protein
MSIKINRLEEGHISYPLVCWRPAETVSLQRRQICYRWGTPAYWSLVPRSSMFYLFEFWLKNMWRVVLAIIYIFYPIFLKKQARNLCMIHNDLPTKWIYIKESARWSGIHYYDAAFFNRKWPQQKQFSPTFRNTVFDEAKAS